MKAVICHQGHLSVEVLPEPVPSATQALLDVHSCGICGSDLHARHHCNNLADAGEKAGIEAAFDALADPESHAKILINPRSDLTIPA